MRLKSVSLLTAVAVLGFATTFGVFGSFQSVAPKPAYAQTTDPYALTGSETSIVVKKDIYNRITVKVKFTFPNLCYNVNMPSGPNGFSQQQLNPTQYFINVSATKYSGSCFQQTQTISQTYELGVLNANTDYTFTVYQSLSPTTVKSVTFRPAYLPYS